MLPCLLPRAGIISIGCQTLLSQGLCATIVFGVALRAMSAYPLRHQLGRTVQLECWQVGQLFVNTHGFFVSGDIWGVYKPLQLLTTRESSIKNR